MKLFIQIRDGQPFEHPILADNFFQVFPHVDENNLPEGFAKFEKLDPPVIDVFEVFDHSFYEMQSDGVVREIWAVRSMTDEEKAAKIQDQVAQVEGLLAFCKNKATEDLAKATGNGAVVLQEYIDTLNAFTYSDPFLANVPPIPRITGDGLMLNNDMPGSAPRVTG
jgi:hypothetical protein